MHIADGVCTPMVIAAGSTASGLGVLYGFRKMDAEKAPQTAVLAAGFFVASLIHIPLPPGSVHLLLPGLMGLVLGWSVFPAVFVAILLQFLFFSYGGITTIGVNTMTMATPAVVCYYLFGSIVSRAHGRRAFVVGFAAGSLGVLLACLLFSLAICASSDAFFPMALGNLVFHLPLAIIEGLVTGAAVSYLRQIRPQVLDFPVLAART